MSKHKLTALITGGSSGIGLGISKALLSHGYQVIIADTKTPDKKLGSPGESVAFINSDISEPSGREATLDFCKSKSDRLDLLVNNAGISVPERKDMLEVQEDTLDLLLNVNLKGPYFLTQSIAKWMISSRKKSDITFKPKIINIASLTSYASATFLAEYALSKSAVSMMTKLYADRLSGNGINVYEIRPGIIETNMTLPSKEKYDQFIAKGGLPIQRWGLPEDVAKAVLALADNLLPYSTGEVINVDGGFHMHRL